MSECINVIRDKLKVLEGCASFHSPRVTFSERQVRVNS